MFFARHTGSSVTPSRRRLGLRVVMVGCAAGSISLAALASTGSNAGAAPSSVVLHYFQKQASLTFYNASNRVIQGYPPLGGHAREDDDDYVGSQSHHAKAWTVTDHLFCTVVASPATADCFTEFAVGGSLLYTDNLTVNLETDTLTVPITGGTGKFAGYTGTLTTKAIGSGNNSNLTISVHKG
jgi:hypothetical protein